ncbi:MAG: hypothetical protein AABY00_01950 [Nanoarchaeota archaeon]
MSGSSRASSKEPAHRAYFIVTDEKLPEDVQQALPLIRLQLEEECDKSVTSPTGKSTWYEFRGYVVEYSPHQDNKNRSLLMVSSNERGVPEQQIDALLKYVGLPFVPRGKPSQMTRGKKLRNRITDVNSYRIAGYSDVESKLI